MSFLEQQLQPQQREAGDVILPTTAAPSATEWR